MELTTENDIQVGDILPAVIQEIEVTSTSKQFIEANTIPSSLEQIKHEHIIPVFIRDNEPVISHAEFIEVALDAAQSAHKQEAILKPIIKLSHPIKGRVPEAKNKPASELQDHEKTIYYERMAFILEVPSIFTEIYGNRLNLTIGGVKAYNLDNLYSKTTEQHFKVFIGFQNTVCTNLCISTDGLLTDLKVKGRDELQEAILNLLQNFNAIQQAEELQQFTQYELTEQQFANPLGRCGMYRHLPSPCRILPLLFGDAQINTVCKDYYSDNSFCSEPDGSINLWKLYNLFTGANKSTYIDSFLDRSVNAYQLVKELQTALKEGNTIWYLN